MRQPTLRLWTSSFSQSWMAPRFLYRHFKVFDVDPAHFEVDGPSSRYRGRWEGQAHRTGLSYRVEQASDFFVSAVPPYQSCDRFDGVLKYPWNMGEAFRSDPGGPPQDALRRKAPLVRAAPVPPPEPSLQRIPLGRNPDSTICIRGGVDRGIVEEIWSRDSYGIRSLGGSSAAVVVDIGAHIGAFSRLARELWPACRVIACEADPQNARLLRQNVEGLAIELVEAAIVADDVSSVLFYAVPDKVRSNSGGGSCQRPEHDSVPIHVPALSIERLWQDSVQGPCDLLKLDCEGSEVPLLERLAKAGRLPEIRLIVGEWHAHERTPQATSQVRQQIAEILGQTHQVGFSSSGAGREGHFRARHRSAVGA